MLANNLQLRAAVTETETTCSDWDSGESETRKIAEEDSSLDATGQDEVGLLNYS